MNTLYIKSNSNCWKRCKSIKILYWEGLKSGLKGGDCHSSALDLWRIQEQVFSSLCEQFSWVKRPLNLTCPTVILIWQVWAAVRMVFCPCKIPKLPRKKGDQDQAYSQAFVLSCWIVMLDWDQWPVTKRIFFSSKIINLFPIPNINSIDENCNNKIFYFVKRSIRRIEWPGLDMRTSTTTQTRPSPSSISSSRTGTKVESSAY